MTDEQQNATPASQPVSLENKMREVEEEKPAKEAEQDSGKSILSLLYRL